MCCSKDHAGPSPLGQVGETVGAVADGAFKGLMSVVGGAILLTLVVFAIRELLPWIIGAAAVTGMFAAGMRLRQFQMRRQVAAAERHNRLAAAARPPVTPQHVLMVDGNGNPVLVPVLTPRLVQPGRDVVRRTAEQVWP